MMMTCWKTMSAQIKKFVLGAALNAIIIFSISNQISGSFAQSVTVLPPLKQIKSGIMAKDVQCAKGLILVLKSENDLPACIRETSLAKLILRGWAKQASESTQTGGKIVTLDQNNEAISLKKGESFLLKLGETHDWTVDIANQTVVSRVMNVMVVKGAQGLYQANNIGDTTLTAVGDPPCYKKIPRCLAPSIMFRLDINVTQ